MNFQDKFISNFKFEKVVYRGHTKRRKIHDKDVKIEVTNNTPKLFPIINKYNNIEQVEKNNDDKFVTVKRAKVSNASYMYECNVSKRFAPSL